MDTIVAGRVQEFLITKHFAEFSSRELRNALPALNWDSVRWYLHYLIRVGCVRSRPVGGGGNNRRSYWQHAPLPVARGHHSEPPWQALQLAWHRIASLNTTPPRRHPMPTGTDTEPKGGSDG